MLKLKLQYFGHLMQRTDLLEAILMLAKTDAKWGLVSPSGWALPDSTLPSSLRPWQCSLSKSGTSLTLPPATARRSNRSTLKEISPEYSLEGLMLMLKLQYFGHLIQRTGSFEKTLILGKTGRRGTTEDG